MSSPKRQRKEYTCTERSAVQASRPQIPAISTWDFVQGISFWLFCGLVVHMAETGLPTFVQGILLTVLLNIPWYLALSIADGKPELLIPLVVASILFGTIIGLINKKLKHA